MQRLSARVRRSVFLALDSPYIAAKEGVDLRLAALLDITRLVFASPSLVTSAAAEGLTLYHLNRSSRVTNDWMESA